MPKYYQFSRVHGIRITPIIVEVMIDYLQEKKLLLVPENKLMSIRNGVRPGPHRVAMGK